MRPQEKINFDKEYVEPILSGKKKTTIRKGIKSYPVGRVVYLLADNKPFAKAVVKKVVVKRVYELTEDDAKIDGFDSVNNLLEALKKIYGSINENEFVSIVYFEIIDKLVESVNEIENIQNNLNTEQF